MQAEQQATDSARIDRFTDRLLNALANLDKYANGYDKQDGYAPQPAPQAPARPDDVA